MAGSWSNSTPDLIVLIEEIAGYSGMFGYSPSIGAGNLVLSIAAAAGTDPYGNDYEEGITVYDSSGSKVRLVAGGGSALEEWTPPDAPGVAWQTGTIAASISNVFGANTAQMTISGPYNRAHVSRPSIALFGSSDSQTTNRVDVTTELMRVTGNATSANHQWATELVSFVAQPSFTQAVVFPIAYDAGTEPTVTTNINSGAAATIRWGSRAISVTNTGFTLFVFKGDAADPSQTWANVKVQWDAYADQ